MSYLGVEVNILSDGFLVRQHPLIDVLPYSFATLTWKVSCILCFLMMPDQNTRIGASYQHVSLNQLQVSTWKNHGNHHPAVLASESFPLCHVFKEKLSSMSSCDMRWASTPRGGMLHPASFHTEATGLSSFQYSPWCLSCTSNWICALLMWAIYTVGRKVAWVVAMIKTKVYQNDINKHKVVYIDNQPLAGKIIQSHDMLPPCKHWKKRGSLVHYIISNTNIYYVN